MPTLIEGPHSYQNFSRRVCEGGGVAKWSIR
jgi:hypothetical protein